MGSDTGVFGQRLVEAPLVRTGQGSRGCHAGLFCKAVDHGWTLHDVLCLIAGREWE